MRFFTLIILCFLSSNIFGQLKPEFFPEDITVENYEGVCYCEPGVVNKSRSKGLVISYGLFDSGNYLPETSNSTSFTPSNLDAFNQFEFKIKVPIILKERTKFLIGYSYYIETYNFENVTESFSETINTLDNNTLKSNGISALVSHSLSEKNYLILRYKYSLNGNYNGFVEIDNRYAIHNFMGLYGFKKSDQFEWGVGFLFSTSFRRTSGLPFLLYNRTFNDRWGIESIFPANFFLRYNLSPLTITALGLEYNSKSFRLDVEDSAGDLLDFAYNHAEILLSLSIERHISSWIWANAKFGYQRNFDSEFDTQNDLTTDFQADLQSGLFFQIGLFVSPSTDRHNNN